MKPRNKPKPLAEAALYGYAVAALGRKMRTVVELKRLMRKKAEPGEEGDHAIEAVLLRLKEYGYIDDAAFASTYIRLRQENDNFGKLRVQRDLARKGVARDVISHAVDAAYGEKDEETLARSYLARKRIAKPQTPKEIARVARRLATAGFSLAVLSRILKSWEIEFNEDDLTGYEAEDEQKIL